MASCTALEVFGSSKSFRAGFVFQKSGCSSSDRPDETNWFGLVGLRRPRGQVSKGFEELLHLLLKENVPGLCVFVSPF